MTLENRLELMKRLHPNSPQTRTGLPNGMRPLPASIPGTSNVPANPAQPDHNADANNPYSSIAARNVFALNPVPPPTQPPDPNDIPPPKITLTGITTIFGPAEALYKVAAYNKNGKQVPEQSYILTEGEAQDEVEVSAIDSQKDVVTFVNHGQTQVIPLANGVATGGDSGSSTPHAPPGFIRRFGGPRPGFGGNPNGNGFNPNPNSNNYNPGGQNDDNNAASQLSSDDKMALIAAQHAQLDQQGSSVGMIFPPTPYDDQAHQAASPTPPAPPAP
jgi:hypothetical protein